jgi:hypothetical protein
MLSATADVPARGEHVTRPQHPPLVQRGPPGEDDLREPRCSGPRPVDESSAGDGRDGTPAPALFDHHLEPGRPHPDAYDEVFHPDGTVRPPYRALDEAIAPTAAADLKVRSEALDRACVDQGVTFSLSGQERPFPLVIVPKVARVLSKEPTPVDAVHAACRRVHEHLTHQRGTTGVHTSA